MGKLPRGFAQRPVGLHRAGTVRVRGRESDRKLRAELLLADRQDRSALPRMDDLERRPLPDEARPEHRHRLHDARDGDGPLDRRQRHAAVRRPDQTQCRRAGAQIRRRGQTLARKDRGGTVRLLHDGERPDRARMQIPAPQRRRPGHAQRFRRRLRLGRRRFETKTQGRPRADDRRGGNLPRHPLRHRSADRRHQRPLRIQE